MPCQLFFSWLFSLPLLSLAFFLVFIPLLTLLPFLLLLLQIPASQKKLMTLFNWNAFPLSLSLLHCSHLIYVNRVQTRSFRGGRSNSGSSSSTTNYYKESSPNATNPDVVPTVKIKGKPCCCSYRKQTESNLHSKQISRVLSS